MTKSEARKLLFEKLKPFCTEHGYKLVIKFSGFRKEANGNMDWINIDCKDYNPVQYIEYSLKKKIGVVHDIWSEVNKKYYDIEQLYIDSTAYTMSFTYEWLNGIFTHLGYLPEIRTEEDVEKNATLMIDFMVNKGFPLLERYNDIREIDKEVNGENFWDDDWRKPFVFNSFLFQRTIIAFLCSNKRLDEIKKHHIESLNKGLSEYPTFQKSIDAYNYLFDILKNIKPLY